RLSAPCLLLSVALTPPPHLPSFPTRRSSDLETPPEVPPAPTGEVTVTGWLLPSETEESTGIKNRSGLPPGQIVLINTEEIGKGLDRKSTRLNSSHVKISYAVFCLKKKKIRTR